MPPDDCFYLEIWSQWHYNKKSRKFKTILISRSSRKMNRYKNLLILYYLQKSFPSFPMHRKKFPMLFHFNFVPQQILNFLFIFYFVKLIPLKLRQCLVSKCIYFRRDSLCFIYFDVVICQQLKKKFKPAEFFSAKPMK